jgi:hypothetical protein
MALSPYPPESLGHDRLHAILADLFYEPVTDGGDLQAIDGFNEVHQARINEDDAAFAAQAEHIKGRDRQSSGALTARRSRCERSDVLRAAACSMNSAVFAC